MITIHHGDCLDVMRGMPDASVDSVVTDPPYHLTSIVKRFGGENAAPAKGGVYARSSAGFMGKAWDGGDIAFQPETWAAVLRVLKPGGYLVAFGSARGHHRLVCAIEDGGFIIHPMLGWICGQGFPKAHKVEAEDWEGWHYGLQSLKPAIEPICLAQRPMSEKTGTLNVLKHGTGALNIDGCRVGYEPEDMATRTARTGAHAGEVYGHAGNVRYSGGEVAPVNPAGRWPANIAHDGSPEVLEAFARFGERTSGSRAEGVRKGLGSDRTFSGTAKGDGGPALESSTGTAARFFYTAKADATERHLGHIAGERNVHPTVKPIDLMQWLCRLITPPCGTVLDPFAGSGSTGIAADREQFNAILIEREAEYVEIMRRRIYGDAPLFADIA